MFDYISKDWLTKLKKTPYPIFGGEARADEFGLREITCLKDHLSGTLTVMRSTSHLQKTNYGNT